MDIEHGPVFKVDANHEPEICGCYRCGSLVFWVAWDGHVDWHRRVEGE